MRYLFVNSVYGVRSTGKLIAAKCRELKQQGHICYVAYGRESKEDEAVLEVPIGTKKDYLFHAVLSRLFDMQGLGSKRATKKFLKEIEALNFDVIWLHNIHGYYINYELLFTWLKQHPSIKVYWTLHDCWAFTGHCVHFTLAKCHKWKKGCGRCIQKRTYPKTLFMDRSKENYLRKKNAFCGVKDLCLITPSQWLADLTRDSFLKDYPVQVIHNSIDLSIFRPREGDFREKNNLQEKFIVLGVAVGWEETKGYQDILLLREILNDDYTIVLVGLTKKQLVQLPDGILGMMRTNNQEELVEIYTAADVLVNPTHQDNYPTVNLEAQACGTPVVTYNVGGSPESVPSENVIKENDINGLAARIEEICRNTYEGN